MGSVQINGKWKMDNKLIERLSPELESELPLWKKKWFEIENSETGAREFDGATEVLHEEHKPIQLGVNEWASGVAQEFDHAERMMRNVAD